MLTLTGIVVAAAFIVIALVRHGKSVSVHLTPVSAKWLADHERERNV